MSIEESDVWEYKDKIIDVIGNSGADIVLGPELAMGNKNNFVTPREMDYFGREIISKLWKGKDQIIIPGTAIVSNGKSLRNTAFVLRNEGALSFVRFDKKSSDREDEIAENLGLEYQRGNEKPVVRFRGKDIGIEICRDHGHARLKNSLEGEVLDMQFILACNLEGFYPEKTVVRDGGIVAVIDGYEPSVVAYRKKDGNFELIKPERETKNYDLVEI